MPIDRESILKRAEKLLRQGRLDAAIADYVQVVTEYPGDWATANLLGDLYVRAGQVAAASQQYTRIAEHLAAEGFTAKAAAVFKKIIKLDPTAEQALLRSAQLAAAQGLTADVRTFMAALTQLRLKRGDRGGVIALAHARVALDPNDIVGRLDAARMLAEAGDLAAAAGELRVAAAALEAQDRTADALRAWREAARFAPDDPATDESLVRLLVRQGDVAGAAACARSAAQLRYLAAACRERGLEDAARDALARLAGMDPRADDARIDLARRCLDAGDLAAAVTWASVDDITERPDLALVLGEAFLRQGRLDEGQALLAEMVSRDPGRSADVDRLAISLRGVDVEAAAAALLVVVDTEVERGLAHAASARLTAFCEGAPDVLAALRRHIDVCVDGGLADDLRVAQLRLADALARRGEWHEARHIIDDLQAADPDDPRYRQRAAAIADALGLAPGQDSRADASAGRTGDEQPAETPAPASLSSDFADLVASLTAADGDAGPTRTEAAARAAVPEPAGDRIVAEPETATPPASRWGAAGLLVVDDALRRLFEDDASPPPAHSGPTVVEIDLSAALGGPPSGIGQRPVPEPAAVAASTGAGLDSSLDAYFRTLREAGGRERALAEQQMAQGRAARAAGRLDAAATHFRAAARDVSVRWQASRDLAALARSRGDLAAAIEWLERAVETPAASSLQAHDVLYELADTLVAAREDARALAVFLELQAADAGYKDVSRRIAALAQSRATSGPEQDGGGA